MTDAAECSFIALPERVSWRHVGRRGGLEHATLSRRPGGGLRAVGRTVATEPAEPSWTVHYALDLDADGRTVRAVIDAHDGTRASRVALVHDGHGRWEVDGRPRPDLDGCFDVDLEASALTNAFPIWRLRLAFGESAEAPAAWVRAGDATVERLPQTYVRARDVPARARVGTTAVGIPLHRFSYDAPTQDFTAEITYDAAGLVVDYPQIAHRIAPAVGVPTP